MKIGPTRFAPEAPPPKVREVRPKQESDGVRVQVSLAAQTLSQGSAEDRVDLQRVAQLRAQLEAGTYHIDDTVLARAILDKELRWTPPR